MPQVMFGWFWGIVLHESIMLVRCWLTITLLVTFILDVLFLVWSMKSYDSWRHTW